MTPRPHISLDGEYTLTEAAALLGKDRKTIYRWRKQGYFKTKRHRHTNRPFVLGREILRFFDAYDAVL